MKRTTLIRVINKFVLAAACAYCHEWIIYEDAQMTLFHYCDKCGHISLPYKKEIGHISFH